MQAITKLLNYIFSALNNNESVLLVMLDISKAYDCIDYKILLKKLENAGIRGNTLQWFESYLRGRGQKVDINVTFQISSKYYSCSRIKSKLFTVYYLCK